MSTTTTYKNSVASFVADPNSLRRSTGRQVDWANVGSGYIDAATGKKRLPAGTVVGDTLGGTGKVSPRVVTTNPAMGILATDANEDAPAEALSGYGVLIGGHLYENLLPDATGGPPKALAGAIKTELTTAGCTFTFENYEDNRTA